MPLFFQDAAAAGFDKTVTGLGSSRGASSVCRKEVYPNEAETGGRVEEGSETGRGVRPTPGRRAGRVPADTHPEWLAEEHLSA